MSASSTISNTRPLVGVDVSMQTLDYCMESSKVERIDNTQLAIRTWVTQLPSDVLVVFEPTGTYSDKLQRTLEQNQLEYRLISPYQSRSFANALGKSNKTDAQDALLLWTLGKSLALPSQKIPSKKMRYRKQLLSSLNALQKQRQQLTNQLHALEQYLEPVDLAKTSLETTLQTVEQQMELLEAKLNSYTDQREQRVRTLMLSVPGIGPKSADLLIQLTDCLDNFQTDKQLIKFIGTAPTVYQSGTSVQFRGRINKKGNTLLRNTLYMAAISARQYNPECKELYLRLKSKGKPHKVAMIAVINKMLRQVFAVVKSGIAFDPEYNQKKKI